MVQIELVIFSKRDKSLMYVMINEFNGIALRGFRCENPEELPFDYELEGLVIGINDNTISISFLVSHKGSPAYKMVSVMGFTANN